MQAPGCNLRCRGSAEGERFLEVSPLVALLRGESTWGYCSGFYGEEDVVSRQASKPLSLRIVLAEANAAARRDLTEIVERKLGYQVIAQVTSGLEMVRVVLETDPDLLLFNVRLPPLGGLQPLRQIQRRQPVAAVALSHEREVKPQSRAVPTGVFGYLNLPVADYQLGPILQVAWFRARDMHALQEENRHLREDLHMHKVLERAKGLLMSGYCWSEDEVLHRLVRGALSRRTSLVKLAQDILDGAKIPL